jgi:transposase
MRPYSMDLRERVVAACDAREGTREQIAQRFGVSTSWIRRLLQRRHQTGSIAALPQNAGRKPKLNDRQMARLKRLVAKRPDAMLRELKKGLGVTMSDDAMIRALRVLGLPRKKSPSGRRSRSARTSRSSGSGGRRPSRT